MLNIDGKKLNDEIKKRNLSVGEVEAAIGRSRSFLSKAVKSGRLKEGDVKLLDLIYNIKYDNIKPDKNELKKAMPEIKIEGITKDELSNLIYKAVYSAVIHAWENDSPRSEVLQRNNS